MHSSTSSRAWARCCAVACALALAGSPAGAAGIVDFLGDALAHSPRLRTAESRIDVSREQAVRAGSWEQPVLEVGVVDLPTTLRFDEDPMTQKMIGVMQRIPIFGASGLARRSGERAVAADSAALDVVRLEVLGQAWSAYAEALAAVQRAITARDHQGAMRRMAQAARARYEAGRGRLAEPLAAEAEAATIAADLARFQAQESAARARLATVTGFPTGRAYGPLEPLPAASVGSDPTPWRRAVADHPRLRARAEVRQQYDLAARAARREQWPNLDVRASYGFRENLAPEFATHGSTAQENMISATVAFTLPLFSGPERAEARAMDAMARAEDSERAQMELELLEAVEASYARARGSERVLGLLADTVLVLRERSLEAAWSAYSSGGTDLAAALEAAHVHYASALEVADARQELAMAHAELLALTGRADLLGVSLPDTTRSKP